MQNGIRQQDIAMLAGLVALSLAGNYFRIELFYGIEVIYGSIFTMIAIIRLGTLAGVTVAAIGSSVLWFAWGHPYAIIIFIAEALFVGYTARRLGNLIWADILYWCVIGIPLVFLFYILVMHIDITQTLLIAMKQPLNGVINALLAILFIFFFELWLHRKKTFNIGNIIQMSIFAAVILPAIFLQAAENRITKDRLEKNMQTELALIASNIEERLLKHSHDTQAQYFDSQYINNHFMDGMSISWRLKNQAGVVLERTQNNSTSPSGEIQKVNDKMLIWIPDFKDKSLMDRWGGARYRYSTPVSIDADNYTLEVERSATSIFDELSDAKIRTTIILFVLIIISGSLSLLISRFLTSPLVQLTRATNGMVKNIRSGSNLTIPKSRLTEVNTLAEEFEEMSASLLSAFTDLSNLASKDELTGIYNRRKLSSCLQDEWHRAVRYKKSFCIVFYDIDFFKHINDEYGHAVGDEVLVEMSNLVKKSLRRNDIIGRWGGEEFLVILPQTDINTANTVAEKIKNKISEFEFSSIKSSVTVSIGVAELAKAESAEELVNKADDALYQAKEAGRNQVCIYKNPDH
ncbi:MAG: diguanylate cyclase [Gammaproteobacteria bacterium]|nr:diguanylate cyclase [Gammaproteobacteria bacterium]